LLGVAVGGLDDGPEQLALPFDGTTGAELDTAVDAIQDRFGTPALTRAVQLGRDHGPAAPLLPD
jgi:DNA polymerase-4